MPFTDPRLPGKEYKTERGLKLGLAALEKRQAQKADIPAPVASVPSIDEPHPERYTGPIFIRNIREVPVSLRLSKEGRRIELRPRGQRGDLAQLKPGEESEPALWDNLGLLIEVLTAPQALAVINKQTINQQAVHPALAQLRTETGDTYEGGVQIVEEFNNQGFLVGTVEEQGPNSIHQSRTVVQRVPREHAEITPGVAPTRAPVVGSQDRPIATVSQSIAPEEQAAWVSGQGDIRALMAADEIARQKGLEGPQAGLGGLSFGGLSDPLAPVVETRFDDSGLNPSDRQPTAPVSGAEVVR